MKKIISLILVMCFLSISFTPKAEATVGLIIDSKATRVVAGITGATSLGIIFGSAAFNAIFGNSYTALALTGFSILGVFIGMVILDEKNPELTFQILSNTAAEKLGLTNLDVDIYNSEIEELNTIKEIIESQVSDNASHVEITRLWNQYKENLSPETMKVASKIAERILQGQVVHAK